MSLVEVSFVSHPDLASLCQNHPALHLVLGKPATFSHSYLEFLQDGLERSILKSNAAEEPILFELDDNNPLLCSSKIFTATGSDLAKKILLRPLIHAGLTQASDVLSVDSLVSSEGLVNVTAEIKTSSIQREDAVECWKEAYDRKPSIRLDEEASPSDLPLAVCSLSFKTNENGNPILKVIGYAKGRLGSVGLIQLLNIACGFDEQLGLEMFF